jgi:predicted dehydrogenase
VRRRARLAVAGLGRIGLLHAGNLFERVPSAGLVRVADANPVRAQRAGEAFAVPWGVDAEDLLTDAGVEGIVIATPSGLHAEMIEAAAHAGKHVLVEKPLAFDVGSAQRAIAAARAAGIELQVGFQRRFDPNWRAACDELHRGTIGAPRLLRIAHRNMAISPDVSLESLGDILIDVTVHDFDTARWLLGEPVEVVAIASFDGPGGQPRPPGCETMVISVRFANGALAVIDATRTSGYGYECSGELVAAEGALRIGIGRPVALEHMIAGEARVSLPIDHEVRHGCAYVAQLEHFARVTLGELEPAATGADGAAALELAEAARTSLARHLPTPLAGVTDAAHTS